MAARKEPAMESVKLTGAKRPPTAATAIAGRPLAAALALTARVGVGRPLTRPAPKPPRRVPLPAGGHLRVIRRACSPELARLPNTLRPAETAIPAPRVGGPPLDQRITGLYFSRK